MKTVSTNYYEYGELGEEARERAFETWEDYMHRNADAVNGAMLAEDLASLKAGLASVACELAHWSVAYDGEEASCQVKISGRLADEFFYGEVGADGLPAAGDDGYWVGVYFSEKWNAEHRPAIAAALESGAVEPEEAADAYLERAQALADECMGHIREDLAYHVGRGWFDQEVADGELYFEEDGTYAPGA